MKKNKGFTLVEVIVILVILAILAAILVPSLTTYIDKAKEKTVAAEARTALIAAQAWASEQYAVGYSADGPYDNSDLEEGGYGTSGEWSGSIEFDVDPKGHVIGFEYSDNGMTLYHYGDGTWHKDDPDPNYKPTNPADDKDEDKNDGETGGEGTTT